MTNRVTLNQARGTDTLAATTGFTGSDATLSSSTDFAAEGSRSLKSVATAITTASAFFQNASFPSDYIPVLTGVTYTAVGSCRKGVGSTTLYHVILIYWYDSAGGGLGYSESSYDTTSTSQFNQVSITAAAPASAAFANVRVANSSSITIGDVYYWDKIGFWEGSGTTWELPNNLLTANQATGTDTLVATTGFLFSACTGASSTTAKYNGARSVATTSTGTGNNYIYCGPTGTGAVPVTGSATVNASLRFYGTAASAGCVAGPQVYWYTAAGAACSPTSVSESTYQTVVNGSWVQVSINTTAPADAAYMRLAGMMQTGVQTSDVLYWDDFVLTETAAATVTGVANYQLTENYAANSDTPSNLVVDGRGSTGTVTLVQTSGTTASKTESPTGVFTLTNPTGTDNLVFELTATGDTADTATFIWTRGGGVTNPIYASEFVKQSDNSWSPTIV